jgi:serine/threonine protein kinase
MATDQALLPPRYSSVEVLAYGGMGEIYVACDETLGREVVVKVLARRFARDRSLRARFTREALAAARLSDDPYTVTIYDVGEWEDRPYIVMEYIRGGTVADRLGDGRVPIGQALDWLEQAASALDHAHARGVVHRDVKPHNLLIAADGSIRVADFGIASAAGLTSVTATGTVLGTAGYLAPEQALGTQAGPAADRYALAVVACELLAGRRPYQSDNGAVEMGAAARGTPPPISSLRRDLPQTLDPVFARALAREPARRYGSAAEFVASLRHALATAAGPTRVAAREPRRRRRWVVPALLAVLAAAAAGVAAGLVLGSRHTTGGGGSAASVAQPSLQTHTVTAQGRTVTVTSVQVQAPPPQPAPETTAASSSTTTQSSSSGSSGVDLNNEGYALMQRRDYQAALPYFEQAVQKLQGTNSTAEAYADYNLAYTRFTLAQCDGVADLLDRSEAIQGKRSEIDALRRQVSSKC